MSYLHLLFLKEKVIVVSVQNNKKEIKERKAIGCKK